MYKKKKLLQRIKINIAAIQNSASRIHLLLRRHNKVLSLRLSYLPKVINVNLKESYKADKINSILEVIFYLHLLHRKCR